MDCSGVLFVLAQDLNVIIHYDPSNLMVGVQFQQTFYSLLDFVIMGISYLAILIILAVAMGVIASYILYLSRNSNSSMKTFTVYLILAMMNGMLIGPAIYFLGVIPFSILDVVVISAGVMALEIAYPLISLVNNLMDERKTMKVNLPVVAFLTIFNEFLMSLIFNAISAGQSISQIYGTNMIKMFSELVSSYWFVFPMSLEMGLTAILTIRKEKGFFFIFILLQSLVMFFTPDAFSNHIWIELSVYLGASVMTILLIYIFESLFRKNFVYQGFSRYILEILGVYGIMMAGVMLFQYNSVETVISIAIIAEMIIYLHAIIKPDYLNRGKKVYWLASQKWSTTFLVLVYIAEVGMGATMDFQFYGTQAFINSMGLASYSSNFLNLLGAFIFNAITFVGLLSLSSFFYIMMGIEMGTLVVFKILNSKELENRIRLVLMMVAFAVYTLLIPSFILPTTAQNYTFLGWSMGIGTAGGLAPALILPMILTYVISGALSLLFGARQLCSVFCSAPLMYQGTFYDSMKKFNKTGKLASSLSKAGEKSKLYRVTSITVYASLGIASVISFLYNYHYIKPLTIYGEDPLQFIYIVLFGIIWYLVFITMPYFGNYGCINTGYCHWGNFNRFVGKYGLFKLKVNDPNQCVTCETKACNDACPVGNTGHPGNFIKKGFYKESRCVGIGDCAEACPYDNIFFYDVRNYIGEKLKPKEKITPQNRN